MSTCHVQTVKRKLRKMQKMTGPLATLFGSASAKVLDQCMTVGNMPQTISMLAESTDLDYKTVQNVVRSFVTKGFMNKLGKIANAQAYKFNVENDLHELIDWATKFQLARKD